MTRLAVETKRSPRESTADEMSDMLPVIAPATNFAAAPTTEHTIATRMAPSSACRASASERRGGGGVVDSGQTLAEASALLRGRRLTGRPSRCLTFDTRTRYRGPRVEEDPRATCGMRALPGLGRGLRHTGGAGPDQRELVCAELRGRRWRRRRLDLDVTGRVCVARRRSHLGCRG